MLLLDGIRQLPRRRSLAPPQTWIDTRTLTGWCDVRLRVRTLGEQVGTGLGADLVVAKHPQLSTDGPP